MHVNDTHLIRLGLNLWPRFPSLSRLMSDLNGDFSPRSTLAKLQSDIISVCFLPFFFPPQIVHVHYRCYDVSLGIFRAINPVNMSILPPAVLGERVEKTHINLYEIFCVYVPIV